MKPGLLVILLLVCCDQFAFPQSAILVLQRGHFGAVTAADLNSTGRQMVTSGSDGSIKVWDAFSQRLIVEAEKQMVMAEISIPFIFPRMTGTSLPYHAMSYRQTDPH